MSISATSSLLPQVTSSRPIITINVLPHDVLQLIFKDFSREQVLQLAAVCKKWHQVYKKMKFVSLKKDLINFHQAFQNRLRHRIEFHPFSDSRIQNLFRCHDFLETKSFIREWLGDIYTWSRNPANTEDAFRLLHYINCIAKSAINPDPFLNQLFSEVLENQVGHLEKFPLNKTIRQHPILLQVHLEHCKRVLGNLELRTPNTENCLKLSKFINRYPFESYFEKGLMSLSDIHCPFIKLEFLRIFQEKLSVEIDVKVIFNRLSNNLQKKALITNLLIHHMDEPTSFRNDILEIYKECSGPLFQECQSERHSPFVKLIFKSFTSKKIKIIALIFFAAALIAAKPLAVSQERDLLSVSDLAFRVLGVSSFIFLGAVCLIADYINRDVIAEYQVKRKFHLIE